MNTDGTWWLDDGLIEPDYNRKYWTTKDGKNLKIETTETSHIKNTINLLKRNIEKFSKSMGARNEMLRLEPIFVHLGNHFFVHIFIYAVGDDRINAAFGTDCCLPLVGIPYDLAAIYGGLTMETITLAGNSN